MSFNKILEKLTTRVLIGILIIFCISIVIRLGTRFAVKFVGVENDIVKAIFYDQPGLLNSNNSRLVVNKEDVIQEVNWKELYPFRYGNNCKNENLKQSDNDNNYDNNFYIELIKKVKTILETWSSELLFGRTKLTEIGNRIEELFKWNIAMPTIGVVKLDNGHFTTFSKQIDVTAIKNSLVEFNNFCLDNNTPFAYILAPHKNCKYDKQLMGNVDFTNRNADNLISMLKNENVPVLDMREELHKANLNHYDCFYKTDHHWTSRTGLWATSVLGEYLNNEYDMNIDLSLFDPSKFESKLYKENYLGSWGRKMSLGKATPDDFELIYPTDDYKFDYKMLKQQYFLYQNTGNFSVLINQNELGEGDFYNRSSYHAYMHGDNESFITNLSENNGKRILLIGDSFTDVIAPFLSLGVSQLDRLDLRYMDGSLHSFIQLNKKFDCIMVMYNPDSIVNTINWNTQNDLYDFR